MDKQKGSPRFTLVEAGLAPILIVLLIASAVGGYLIYINYSNNRNKTVFQQTKSTPIPTPKNESTSSAASSAPNGAAETANWKTYTSPEYNPFYTDKELEGVTAENIQEKLGGGYANPENIKRVKFSIMFPKDWQVNNEKMGLRAQEDPYGSAFIFTKNNIEIKIARFVAPEGNLCDKDFLGYGNNYKDIKTDFTTFRRVKDFENTDTITKGYIGFTLCQKIGTSFASNTSLGKITFTLPKDYNQNDLDLMDKIISTLQQI